MWRQQRTQAVLVATCIVIFLLVAAYTFSDEPQFQLKNHVLQLGSHGVQGQVVDTKGSKAESKGSSSSTSSDDETDKDSVQAQDAQRTPDTPTKADDAESKGQQQTEPGKDGENSEESGPNRDPNTESRYSKPVTPKPDMGYKDSEQKEPAPEEKEESTKSGWRKVDSKPATATETSKQALDQSPLRTHLMGVTSGDKDSSAPNGSRPAVDYSEFSKVVVKETKDFAKDLADAKSSVSYDKTSPPSVGCEDIVSELQSMVIEAFAQELKGIRHAHIFGLLDKTENKGDAVIWVAQEILLATLGITTMETCRYIDKDCDVPKWEAGLKENAPHSGIIMAGGGNFNDFFEDDHPARLKMVKEYGDRYPIRMFPQSINMTTPKWTQQTLEVFANATDAQLGARDLPSYEWLDKAFGEDETTGARVGAVRRTLTPDIAFMFGNRPDFRWHTNKTHDVYILARDDSEVAEGESKKLALGDGVLDFGPDAGDVTYLKNDWRRTPTPMDGAEGPKQRNWAKAMHGFEILASAEFVITDRLHGHIMCTLMGIPHVLMDSKLKKNLFFHDTWTKDCDCVRVADNIEEAVGIAQLYFEKQTRDGLREKRVLDKEPKEQGQ